MFMRALHTHFGDRTMFMRALHTHFGDRTMFMRALRTHFIDRTMFVRTLHKETDHPQRHPYRPESPLVSQLKL